MRTGPHTRRAGIALAGALAAWLSLQGAAGAEGALFEAPAPGSYELPPITRVQEHELLAPDGARTHLLGLAPGQAALVAFIYRGCSDAAGCPTVLATLQRIDAELARRPSLASRARLVSVSFDPLHDTPERMGELASQLSPKTDWRFLTAPSTAELAPVLADFGQDVTSLVDVKGEPTGVLRHVVKVYLVDGRRDVRNVYSTGLLSIPLLLADLETVTNERREAAQTGR
jgi:cytochrome c peroxidase